MNDTQKRNLVFFENLAMFEKTGGNMKKIMVLVSCAFLSITAINCGGKKTLSNQPEIKKDIKVPDFVLNPPKGNDCVFASGSYAITVDDRDPNYAKTMADNRARQEIQQSLSSKIATSVKDFMQKLGHNTVETDEATKTAAVTIGKLDVSGAEIVKREIIDGVMYSLARFSLDESKRQMLAKSTSDAIYGNEALRSKMESEKATASLEKSLMDDLGKPAN